MEHFTEDDVGKRVVDARGEPLGKVAGIQDGQARLEPETGAESRMEAAADPDHDALDVLPEQVVEVDPEKIRVELED